MVWVPDPGPTRSPPLLDQQSWNQSWNKVRSVFAGICCRCCVRGDTEEASALMDSLAHMHFASRRRCHDVSQMLYHAQERHKGKGSSKLLLQPLGIQNVGAAPSCLAR